MHGEKRAGRRCRPLEGGRQPRGTHVGRQVRRLGGRRGIVILGLVDQLSQRLGSLGAISQLR